jgi:hypothetical protein
MCFVLISWGITLWAAEVFWRESRKHHFLPVIQDSTFTSTRDVLVLRFVRRLCGNRTCVNVSYRVNIPSDHNLSPLLNPENVLLCQRCSKLDLTSISHTNATSPSPPLLFLPSNQSPAFARATLPYHSHFQRQDHQISAERTSVLPWDRASCLSGLRATQSLREQADHHRPRHAEVCSLCCWR